MTDIQIIEVQADELLDEATKTHKAPNVWVLKEVSLQLDSEQLRTIRNALRHEWQRLQPMLDQVSVEIARAPETSPERIGLLERHARYRRQQAATDEILLQLARI